MTLLMDTSLSKQDRAALGKHRPDPPEVVDQSSPDFAPYISVRRGGYNGSAGLAGRSAAASGDRFDTPTIAGRSSRSCST